MVNHSARIPIKQFAFALVHATIFFTSCHPKPPLFNKIAASASGIHFNNTIIENDSINPIDLDFLYNGGGVAMGDFNNDGLPDLYFTASTVSNKLYLNKGGLSFTDITATAKVSGEGSWCNAASVADINNDGWQDIYVCTSIKSNPEQRKNLLYMNQGLNREGVPVFKEMAAAYGLADTSYSVHAAFFDYDNDGDLDMYLLTTRLAKSESVIFSSNKTENNTADVDKLYRNDWNDTLQHPVFTDVSKQAGITDVGFGLGVAIADINRDGWKDIYISNDFFGSDQLYINNKNGSFTNEIRAYCKHTSQNAMGNDIADINNDGLADIISVDMNPEDNYRKKTNMSSNNYFIYQNMLYEKLELQYVRNTLQLNSGPVPGSNDSVQHPVFSDIAFYTGTAETDWSWSPLLADVDNDGNRDILITNGYPRDVTDHDFTAFRGKARNLVGKDQLIAEIPSIKVPNCAFKNNGRLQFENSSTAWGITDPSFSNGAVCADLDNDGDLDYVVNNINDPAFVYENTSRSAENKSANYITVQFNGNKKNPAGIGAWAAIFYDKGKQQVYENSPYRGYLSTGDTKAFFGLGSITAIDSVVITWTGGKQQTILNPPVNQLLKVAEKNAALSVNPEMQILNKNALFTDISSVTGINYRHQEQDYIDFDKERLLPHKFSEYGPALAAGDVDGNGLDDLFIGGGGDYPGKFLLQQRNGKFETKDLPAVTAKDARRPENMGVLLFDADNDGDLDLYCASGSNEFIANTKNYQDQFFVNTGKGNFIYDSTVSLPVNYTSKSCVKAADFDNDGDLDLFIGGRCLPGKYPLPVSSFIYRNDSRNGKIVFTDISASVSKDLQQAGMVCDALWTDFNNDGWTDLIMLGEWMAPVLLQNKQGKFENITAQSGIANQYGWWNSLVAGDFDNDGDMDYVAGNLGQNAYLRASDQYPVNIYAKDFDGNESIDAIITHFLKSPDGTKKEYTALNRDDIMTQLPGLKKKFLTYKDFANAGFHDLFTGAQMKNVLTLHVNNFKSCFIKNLGKGKFSLEALPVAAQLSPLFGMVAADVNNDGNLDIAIAGNDFGNEVTNGRYDAFNGLIMTGDGKGNFQPQTPAKAGFYLPGDSKALVTLRGPDNTFLLVATENKGPIKIFRSRIAGQKMVAMNNDDKTIFITFANGQTRMEEVYYGSSFFSQSARCIPVSGSIKKISITNTRGQKREIRLQSAYPLLNKR